MPLEELNCSSCTSTDLLKLMCFDILSIRSFSAWSSKFVASKLHSVKYCKANSILFFLSFFFFFHSSSLSMIETSCLPLEDLGINLQSQNSFLSHPVPFETAKTLTSALMNVGLNPKLYSFHKAQAYTFLNAFSSHWYLSVSDYIMIHMILQLRHKKP